MKNMLENRTKKITIIINVIYIFIAAFLLMTVNNGEWPPTIGELLNLFTFFTAPLSVFLYLAKHQPFLKKIAIVLNICCMALLATLAIRLIASDAFDLVSVLFLWVFPSFNLYTLWLYKSFELFDLFLKRVQSITVFLNLFFIFFIMWWFYVQDVYDYVLSSELPWLFTFLIISLCSLYVMASPLMLRLITIAANVLFSFLALSLMFESIEAFSYFSLFLIMPFFNLYVIGLNKYPHLFKVPRI